MTEFYDAMIRRLEDPLRWPWQAHGIGMLRTYLDNDRRVRLNLWHSSLINPGISTMHTHPWEFRSFVMLGRLTNYRWERREPDTPNARPFIEDKITCGPGFDGLKGEAQTVWLRQGMAEYHSAGMSYSQKPDEIHTTEFIDGSATVIVRGPPSESHEASVFWPLGDQWGDATRPVTEADIWTVVSAAVAHVPQAAP